MRHDIDYSRFDLISFDCYGTLIDWETGILKAFSPLFASREIALDPDQLLEKYAEFEAASETGKHRKYREVLSLVTRQIADEFGFELIETERSCLVDSLGNWPAFSDTVSALQRLKKKYRLAIISNVDNDLIAQTRKTLVVPFDFVVTAEQAGAYKPDLKVFDCAYETFGITKDRWLHVAQSLYHDIAPAREFGLTTIWINRRKGKSGGGATKRSQAAPHAEYADLKTFAENFTA
jgi:2-haloacid dehalogenase